MMRYRSCSLVLPMLFASLMLSCNDGDAVLGAAAQPDAASFDAAIDTGDGPLMVTDGSPFEPFPGFGLDPSGPCAATPLPGCPGLIPAQSWPSDLAASDIGADVEFTACDLYFRDVVVAARSSSEGPFVMAGTFDAVPVPDWTWRKLAPSPPRVNAAIEGVVVDVDSYAGDTATALICESSDCHLYTAQFDPTADAGAEGPLELVPDSLLPSHTVIRGLTLRGPYGSSAQVCAYGDGLFCFHDAAWETLAPAGAMPLFEAAASDIRGWVLTAGSDGVVRGFHDGLHDDVQVVGAPRLRSIYAFALDWAAGGENGEVLFVPTIEGVHACRLEPEPIIGVGTNGGMAAFLSASGRYVQGRTSTGWCQGPSVPEPIIAASADTCGVGLNLVALSRHALYGSLVGCPVP